MTISKFKLVYRSLHFYRKDALYQVIIVSLLTAIITGSLLTGSSVRSSLRKTTLEKIGNTDLVISSGLRYFDASLAERISGQTDDKIVALLEADGFCQNFSDGATALNTKIYGVDSDFFSFHGEDSLIIQPGTAAINKRLALHLGVREGDEIILKFRETDPIPDNAPFVPAGESTRSKVMRISTILTPDETGNFSLGASQIEPMNVFINIRDAGDGDPSEVKSNRLLINKLAGNDDSLLFRLLKKNLKPEDIGLTVRRSGKTGGYELISDRIFIDSSVVEEVTRSIPSADPIITYLANSFSFKDRSVPYSFAAALPSELLGKLKDDEIIINRWLADDLGAFPDDTLTVTWFDPGQGGELRENSGQFVINRVEPDDSRYSDPSLMPEFPGISGRTSCSSWDAGIPILLDKIREKDEDYWNRYKGTPKAFINYSEGKILWGNNYGPATAIRFSLSVDSSIIINNLSGNLDPAKTGFSIINTRSQNIKSATEGVDFSTLFLSLGMFIILSCIILLTLALTSFFDSRKKQVSTYHALGFTNRTISTLFIAETAILAVAGALIGTFMGYFINVLIINALNSVWSGAVQTDTLDAGFSLTSIAAGFLTTLIIALLILVIKVRKFLCSLSGVKQETVIRHSSEKNLIFLMSAFFSALTFIVFSILLSDQSVLFSFAGGVLIFLGMILLIKQYYIRSTGNAGVFKPDYSRLFYSAYPLHIITPVIFIAAGIFAVIITGANRQVLSDKMLLRQGGTGGYLLWAESALPVPQNLNSKDGKKEFGLDEPGLNRIEIIQAKRLSGDDASCLNIAHVKSPPVLGINPADFIRRGSFSFASTIKQAEDVNPWNLLNEKMEGNTIYGVADQTVLTWGLKIKTGDTIKYRSENGQLLNIVICGGLKSSLFQGYLLIGQANFDKWFPSVPGSSVFLVDGNMESSDLYRTILQERLSGYGLSVASAGDKLASFFKVTNTYLDVFMVLGAFGIILGAAGLGFILLRNYNRRRQEFALMAAAGFSTGKIRRFLLKDQAIILIWGVLTGTLSAMAATLPSIKSGTDMPWILITVMILIIVLIGLTALFISVRQVRTATLVKGLRSE